MNTRVDVAVLVRRDNDVGARAISELKSVSTEAFRRGVVAGRRVGERTQVPAHESLVVGRDDRVDLNHATLLVAVLGCKRQSENTRCGQSSSFGLTLVRLQSLQRHGAVSVVRVVVGANAISAQPSSAVDALLEREVGSASAETYTHTTTVSDPSYNQAKAQD